MNAANSITTLRERMATAGALVWQWMANEIGQIIDLEAWRRSRTFGERMQALSWPRLAVVVSVVVLAVGGCAWLLTRDDDGIRAHPPRLPSRSELEIREGNLARYQPEPSPALARANQSVTRAGAVDTENEE